MADSEIKIVLRADADSKLPGDLKKANASFKQAAKEVGEAYKGTITIGDKGGGDGRGISGTWKAFAEESGLQVKGGGDILAEETRKNAQINYWRGRRKIREIREQAAKAAKSAFHMTPDWMLKQGQERALSMGPLFPMPPIPKPPAPLVPPANTLAGMFHRVTNFQMSPLGVALTKVAAGIAAFRVSLRLVSFAANFALTPVKLLAKSMLEAANSAAQLYAKQLQSGGLPGGFVARRSALAQVVGVGESEVLRYAGAVRQLNGQFGWYTRIMRETTPSLTSVSWAWRTLMLDVKAGVAMVAAPWASVVRSQINGIDSVFKMLAGTLALLSKAAAGVFKIFNSGLLAFARIAEIIAGQNTRNAAAPVVSANRYQSSAWERMGLVIGGGGSNPAQATARNTARMVGQLGKLVALMSGAPNGMGSLETHAQRP